MQESLLQFIWQYSLYNPASLRTQSGDPVTVIHPGTLNRDAGPDFSMARIRIGDTLLVGNVELHVRTSDWARHGHDADRAYDRIILHVVFEHDQQNNRSTQPLLELKPHVPAYVIERYSRLIQTTAVLPCAGALGRVNDIIRSSWQSRMLVERWEQKLGHWTEELAQAGGDWQTLLWWRFASNFGFKINAAPFLLLAQSLPLQVLARQTGRLQVEALLFGQAGFLNGHFEDAYPQSLQREYAFLKHKYALTAIEPHLWKFMRLRPANFPTIRIAQLAALLQQSPQLFAAISGRVSAASMIASLSCDAGEYWKTHYRFDDPPSKKSVKKLGADSVQNIIINTVAPIRFLYAHTHNDLSASESALQLLDALPAEDNQVIRLWESHGWKCETAAQTQGLIHLYNSYCTGKRCLECAVGLNIIRSGPDK